MKSRANYRVNKIYSLTKKREYNQVLSQSINFLKNDKIDNETYKVIARKLIDTVREMGTEANYLPILPVAYKKRVLSKVTASSQTVLRGRFLRTIKDLWTNVYKVGKKHAVTDILMNTNMFTNQFKKASFSSIEGVTLLDLVPEEEVAEFAEGEELTPQQRKTIARAKRNLTILRNNVNRLKAEGVLYDSFNLEESSGVAARLTIEQRISFLETIQEIDDLLRKAEASEKTFLSDEYLQRRYRVLTDDYASMYDNYIQEQMASYLDKNIEGVNQILNKERDAQSLANSIATEIQSAPISVVNPVQKAEVIMRTELGLAYNFGKLLGFTSPNDLNRRFRWNADWELEGKKDYEVCKACSAMDGRVYSVRDLLNVGTRLDRGVLNYRGQTRTDFKNPALPMIPFHPNCSCYWTLEPEDTWEEENAERFVDTTIPPPAPPIPGTRADVAPLENDTIPITVGTGLLVGGLFLLARSNVWRLFYKTAIELADDIPKVTPVQQFIDVTKFLVDEAPEEVVQRYKDIITTTIRTAPEQLPDAVPQNVVTRLNRPAAIP